MKKILGVLFVLLGGGILLLERNFLYKIFSKTWESIDRFESFSSQNFGRIADDLLIFASFSPIWIIPIILIWIGIKFFRGKDIRVSGIFLGIMVCILMTIIFIFAYTMANA